LRLRPRGAGPKRGEHRHVFQHGSSGSGSSTQPGAMHIVTNVPKIATTVATATAKPSGRAQGTSCRLYENKATAQEKLQNSEIDHVLPPSENRFNINFMNFCSEKNAK
jgi:hypothetical protein